jgi:hypothetical protein
MKLKYWHTFFMAETPPSPVVNVALWILVGEGYWKVVEYKLREIARRPLCPAGQNNTL